jgi:DNA-binding Xre family transcriptional regulator
MFVFDASKVEQARIDQRYKVKDLAKVLSISTVQMSAKLKGRADFKGEEISKLSRHFNIKPGDFFTEKE